MKTQTRRRIFIIIILCIVIAGILWYRGGWDKALRSQGLKSSEMTVLFSAKDSEGGRIRVLTNFGESEDPVLVTMIRERWGLWKVVGCDCQALESSYDYRGSKSYPPEYPMTIEDEYHLYYCGNDAVTKIESLDDVLPGGVTAAIRQMGKQYLIHFVSYGEYSMNSLPTLRPEDLLKQKGYVPDTGR